MRSPPSVRCEAHLLSAGIKRHQLLHLARRTKEAGPLWTLAMWSCEALWGRLVRWNKQKGHPEKSILSSYLALKVSGAR